MNDKRSYVGQLVTGGWCVYWYDAKTDAWHEGQQHKTKRAATDALREDQARSEAARALGSIRSERKAAASRANGLKGGRPHNLRGGRHRPT